MHNLDIFIMELFARNISNLTDARYFAAYLPTWISIDLSDNEPATFQRMSEIQSWVEGVSWAIEPLDVSQIESAEEQLNIQGLVLHSVQQCLEAPSHLAKFLVMHETEDIDAMIDREIITGLILTPSSPWDRKWLDTTECWFMVHSEEDATMALKYADYIKGIVAGGGPEEKVGFKSYTEVDALLEKLGVID